MSTNAESRWDLGCDASARGCLVVSTRTRAIQNVGALCREGIPGASCDVERLQRQANRIRGFIFHLHGCDCHRCNRRAIQHNAVHTTSEEELRMKSHTVATIVLLALIIPLYVSAAPITLQAGDMDDFSPGDPADVTTRRSGFDAAVRFEVNNNDFHNNNPREFDVWYDARAGNHTFGYSFENLLEIKPGAPVMLELGLKADASTSLTEDIGLMYVGTPPTERSPLPLITDFLWGRSLTMLGLPDPWDHSAMGTLILDLRSLPTPAGGFVNLVPDINAAGYLDIYIRDDTAVDYIKLSYHAAAPAPATLGIVLLGLALMVSSIRASRRIH